MTNIWTDKFIELWASEDIKLSPSTTNDAIKLTEEILDFQFPDDFKEFYSKLDGFVEWTGQKICFQFGRY